MSEGISRENIYTFEEYPILARIETLEVYGQYFDSVVKFGEDENFVDAGVLDCDSSFDFIAHCPNYQAIYMFEPDKDSYNRCKEILSRNTRYENMFLYEYGLWNKKDTLHFKMSRGASKIAESGENVRVVSETNE